VRGSSPCASTARSGGITSTLVARDPSSRHNGGREEDAALPKPLPRRRCEHEKTAISSGFLRWAILGSNSPLGLGLGQIARFYLDSVPSDQLGFAQIATKIATKPAPFAALVTIARTPPVRPKQQRHQRRRWLPLAKGKQAPRPCNWRRAGRVGVGGAGVCAERHAAHWLSLEKTSSRPLTSSA
jgi:hypothetical protein